MPEDQTPELPADAPPKRRRRVLRIVRWVLGILGLVVVVMIVSVLLLLESLNRPFVQARVHAYLSYAVGAPVTYDDLSISLFSGVKAKSIRVGSPPPFDRHAPEMLLITNLDVEVDFWRLVLGDVRVGRAHADEIKLTLVSDSQGRSSLGLLAEHAKEEPVEETKATPLSQFLASPPVIVEDFRVGSVELESIEIDGNKVSRRTQLAGLMLDGFLKGTKTTHAALRVTVPEILSGLQVSIEDHGQTEPRKALLGFDLQVATVDANTVSVKARIDVHKQDLLQTQVPAKRLLELDMQVVFGKTERKTKLQVKNLSLLDDAIIAQLNLDLFDQEDGTLRALANATGTFQVAKLVVPFAGAEVHNATGSYKLDQLEYAGAGLVGGAAELKGEIEQVRFDPQVGQATLSGVSVAAAGNFRGPGQGSVTAKLASRSLAYKQLVRASSSTRTRARASPTALDLSLSGLEMRFSGTGLSVLRSSPAPTGEKSTNEAGLRFASLGVKMGRETLSITDFAVSATGPGWLESVARDEGVTATVTMPIGKIAARTKEGTSVTLVGVHASLDALGVRPVESGRFPIGGKVSTQLRIASVNAKTFAQMIKARNLGFSAQVQLDGNGWMSGDLPIGSIEARDRVSGKTALSLKQAKLSWKLLQPTNLWPAQSKETGKLEVTGTVARVGLGRQTSLSLPKLNLRAKKTDASVYEIKLNSAVGSLRANGHRLAGQRVLKASLGVKLDPLGLALNVSLTGGPHIDANVVAGFDPGNKSLSYVADLAVRDLGRVGKLVGETARSAGNVDWPQASLTMHGTGTLVGVLKKSSDQALPVLVADPMKSLRGTQTWRGQLGSIVYVTPTMSVRLPRASWQMQSRHKRDHARAELVARVPRLIYKDTSQTPANSVDVRGLREKIVISIGPSSGARALTVTATTDAKSVEQTFFKGYPILDAKLIAELDASGAQSLHVRKIVFVNPAGGTRLEANGVLEQHAKEGAAFEETSDAILARDAFSLQGTFSQKLDALVPAGLAKRAEGQIVAPFRLESGDLVSFRLAAKVNAKNVTIETPGGLIVEQLNGVIPVAQEVLVLDSGVTLVPDARENVVARTRFFDVHPFLNSEDYLRAKSIEVGGQRFGPIAGNLRLDDSTFALAQLQVGFRGGVITGQLIADVRASGPGVRFKGSITGVRSQKSTSVLDANATLSFRPDTLALDGKIQVVRIGKAHLHEFLDLVDPYHQNVKINRVRLGLKYGYPKFLRIQIRDGLMDAKIALGGLAGAVRIDDITAQPVAPIMELYVAPLLRASEGP